MEFYKVTIQFFKNTKNITPDLRARYKLKIEDSLIFLAHICPGCFDGFSYRKMMFTLFAYYIDVSLERDFNYLKDWLDKYGETL